MSTPEPTTWPKAQSLIRARAEGYRTTIDNKGTGMAVGAVLDQMATDLDAYERDQGITYVPLPTEALKRLRMAWEYGSDASFAHNAAVLIRDVFGGIDGHLVRIDHTLEEQEFGFEDEDLPTDLGRGQQREG